MKALYAAGTIGMSIPQQIGLTYQMLKDKRKSTRRAIRYTAWVGLGEGAPLRGCIVFDISETGAKLELDHPEELPETFNLLLSDRGDIHRRCHAVWRSKTQIGVHFEKAGTHVQPSEPGKKIPEPINAA